MLLILYDCSFNCIAESSAYMSNLSHSDEYRNAFPESTLNILEKRKSIEKNHVSSESRILENALGLFNFSKKSKT